MSEVGIGGMSSTGKVAHPRTLNFLWAARIDPFLEFGHLWRQLEVHRHCQKLRKPRFALGNFCLVESLSTTT